MNQRSSCFHITVLIFPCGLMPTRISNLSVCSERPIWNSILLPSIETVTVKKDLWNHFQLFFSLITKRKVLWTNARSTLMYNNFKLYTWAKLIPGQNLEGQFTRCNLQDGVIWYKVRSYCQRRWFKSFLFIFFICLKPNKAFVSIMNQYQIRSQIWRSFSAGAMWN